MSDKSIDFGELVEQVTNTQNWVGSENLSLWGGECAQADLEKFLRDWSLPHTAMNYVVWESVSDLRLRDWRDVDVQFTKARIDELERARIFGAQGDLSLIRTGEKFRWYIAGQAGTTPPAGYALAENNFVTVQVIDDSGNNDGGLSPQIAAAHALVR